MENNVVPVYIYISIEQNIQWVANIEDSSEGLFLSNTFVIIKQLITNFVNRIICVILCIILWFILELLLKLKKNIGTKFIFHHQSRQSQLIHFWNELYIVFMQKNIVAGRCIHNKTIKKNKQFYALQRIQSWMLW